MTYIRKGDDHLEDELRNQGLREKKNALQSLYCFTIVNFCLQRSEPINNEKSPQYP